MLNFIMPGKDLFRIFFFLISYISTTYVYGDNWHASVSSSIQSDNRFSSANSVSADMLFTYAYDDADNDLHSRLNFLIRESEYFFERGNDLYEFSVEKGWAEYNTRLKAGRFERSDNLGYYFLDGISLTQQLNQKDLSLELYMGKPGRIDDVRSINGDYLFGMELFSHQKNTWDNDFLPLVLDTLDIRLGLQKIKNISIAHRINLAVNTQGKIQEPQKDSHCYFDCQRFKSQLLLSYHSEKNEIEDLFVDIRIPVNQDLRLRFAYEYYHPDDEPNPGFREQFYSYYAYGDQRLSRLNIDYYFTRQISAFIEALHSNREVGDKGVGFGTGVKIRKLLFNDLDLDLTVSMDTLELGENTVDSFYVNLEYYFNSRINIQLDSVYREEEKLMFGNNRVLGFNGKINYMAKNNLVFSLEAREINNSRLRNEHLARLNMTYYFDNYKVKSSALKLNQLN